MLERVPPDASTPAARTRFEVMEIEFSLIHVRVVFRLIFQGFHLIQAAPVPLSADETGGEEGFG